MNISINTNTELGRKAAISEYIATKSRVSNYLVTYRRYFYDDGSDDYTPGYFKEFTAEQLVIVKELLELCKSEGIDIWEAIEEDEEKYAFLQQEVDQAHWYLVPDDIDIEKVYYRYLFKLAVFYDGIDSKPKVHDVRICLSDEEYVELLDWKMRHPHSGLNFLRVTNPELYKKLCDKFDSCFNSDEFPLFYAPTYAVGMTEVEEDVKQIKAAYDIK